MWVGVFIAKAQGVLCPYTSGCVSSLALHLGKHAVAMATLYKVADCSRGIFRVGKKGTKLYNLLFIIFMIHNHQ